MDVTSLYANVSQEDGIETLWRAYDYVTKQKSPYPHHYYIRTSTRANPNTDETELLWKLKLQFTVPTFSRRKWKQASLTKMR